MNYNNNKKGFTPAPIPLRRDGAGFTLIELLVVVGIIGLISTLAFVNLSSSGAKGRDAKRKSDIKNLQTALELYYDDHQQYPAAPTNTRVSSMISGETDIQPYISPIPADPVNIGSAGYRYNISNVNGRQSYTMLIRMENDTTTWCNVSIPPGNTGWQIPAYPPCDFEN